MKPSSFSYGRAVEPLVVRRSVLGPEFARHVDDRGARHRGLEAVRLCHGPCRHVAAVRPSADAQAIRIGDALRHEPVGAGHDVGEIAAAPVAAVHLDEVLAIPGGSANVGIEDGVASRHKQLSPGFERIAPPAGRTAVDQDHGWPWLMASLAEPTLPAESAAPLRSRCRRRSCISRTRERRAAGRSIVSLNVVTARAGPPGVFSQSSGACVAFSPT